MEFECNGREYIPDCHNYSLLYLIQPEETLLVRGEFGPVNDTLLLPYKVLRDGTLVLTTPSPRAKTPKPDREWE